MNVESKMNFMVCASTTTGDELTENAFFETLEGAMIQVELLVPQLWMGKPPENELPQLWMGKPPENELPQLTKEREEGGPLWIAEHIYVMPVNDKHNGWTWIAGEGWFDGTVPSKEDHEKRCEKHDDQA